MSAFHGKSAAALAVWLLLATLPAAAAPPPRAPAAWAAARLAELARDADGIDAARFVRRVVAAREGEGGGLALIPALGAAAWERQTGTALARVPSLAYSIKLNGLEATPALTPSALQALAQADLVLVDDGEGSLVAYAAGGELGRARLADPPEVASLAQGLRQILGYDGVVLDDGGEYVLSLSAGLAGRSERFALVLDASADRLAVPAAAGQRGAELLRLVATGGPYAVFRKVAARSRQRVPYGAKLVLEQADGASPSQ